MIVTNLSTQTYLFREGEERFTLDGRAIATKAPEWLMENNFALGLREQDKITFEVKKKPTTKIEELKIRADELEIVYGDNITVATLEKKVKAKEKELQDNDKEKELQDNDKK